MEHRHMLVVIYHQAIRVYENELKSTQPERLRPHDPRGEEQHQQVGLNCAHTIGQRK
jgi:hypothetical protein